MLSVPSYILVDFDPAELTGNVALDYFAPVRSYGMLRGGTTNADPE